VTMAAAKGSARPRLVSLAEVRRDSLIADARILAGRGLSTRAIGRRLGVAHSTVVRWLA